MACQLVADVGNTDTVFALAEPDGREVRAHWRIRTAAERTADELAVMLRRLMAASANQLGPIRRAVIGSVVPACDAALRRALDEIAEGPVLQLTGKAALPIRIDVEAPGAVGADRIANALSAWDRYRRDTIAVDLGTATTFDCVTAGGVFLGGAIAPGLRAGAEWLADRTAKLPRVDLVPPSEVIGRSTEACLRSGVFHSAIGGVEAILERIRGEWESAEPLVVATGGFSSTVGPLLSRVDRVEPLLTLEGLAIAGRYLD